MLPPLMYVELMLQVGGFYLAILSCKQHRWVHVIMSIRYYVWQIDYGHGSLHTHYMMVALITIWYTHIKVISTIQYMLDRETD
jgi:hypothetical protein